MMAIAQISDVTSFRPSGTGLEQVISHTVIDIVLS